MRHVICSVLIPMSVVGKQGLESYLDVSDMQVDGVFCSSVLFDIGHANATLCVLTDLLILFTEVARLCLDCSFLKQCLGNVLHAENWDRHFSHIVIFPYLRNCSLALHVVQYLKTFRLYILSDCLLISIAP